MWGSQATRAWQMASPHLRGENPCAGGTLECGSSISRFPLRIGGGKRVRSGSCGDRFPLKIGGTNRKRKAVAAATAVQSPSRIFGGCGKSQTHWDPL
jgi:hypothetical protein